MFTGRARVNYLSTLSFDSDFLKAVEAVCPDVEVRQLTADAADQIDPAVWAQVDVLHTSSALCDPALAPRLRWVQLDTSGVDHLRSAAVWDSDVAITTIGGISPVPLAEYVLWAILGTAHQLPELLQVRGSRQWPSPQERWQRMLPKPVRGATVGIVGYGRIGREIGRLAEAFGMNVLGVSRSGAVAESIHQYNPAAATGSSAAEIFPPSGLPEVLRRSDYLVVVVPKTAQTAGLIDADALAQLKDQAVVINVARGGIVDEDALRAGLLTGRIRAAVLDVFDAEPLAADDLWWSTDNVFVTPHVSGLAPMYTPQVLELACENLRRFAEGRPLLNVVDRAAGY